MNPGTTHLPRTCASSTSAPSPAAIPLPDRATTPSFRITSASASTPRPGSMTRPPRRQRSIRPGPLDRRSRGASQRVSALRAIELIAVVDARTERRRRRRQSAVANEAEATVDLCARFRGRELRQAPLNAGGVGRADAFDLTDEPHTRAHCLHARQLGAAGARRRLLVAPEEPAAAADAGDVGIAFARAPARLG